MINKVVIKTALLLLLSTVLATVAFSETIETEVLVTVSNDKLLAFSASSNAWVSVDLALKERVISKQAAGNVCVAITSSRILGFSAFTNRWESRDIKKGETIDEVSVEGNAAVVTTNLRVMGFNAHSGSWLITR